MIQCFSFYLMTYRGYSQTARDWLWTETRRKRQTERKDEHRGRQGEIQRETQCENQHVFISYSLISAGKQVCSLNSCACGWRVCMHVWRTGWSECVLISILLFFCFVFLLTCLRGYISIKTLSVFIQIPTSFWGKQTHTLSLSLLLSFAKLSAHPSFF